MNDVAPMSDEDGMSFVVGVVVEMQLGIGFLC